MSSKSIISSQHFQCNTDCFNLPQTHYLTFTHTEFSLYQHTLNNKGSFSISSPTFIFTGKQKICTKGNRKISTSLPHCHLTHENSRQTCLAVQLNHILSHSVNRKKPIQNHWQSHKKKKKDQLKGIGYAMLRALACIHYTTSCLVTLPYIKNLCSTAELQEPFWTVTDLFVFK